MKSSYSQNSAYVKCPKSWHYNYVDRLVAPQTGASLPFGSAIDSAVMQLLEGASDWKQLFFKRWKTMSSFGKQTEVFDNPDITYAHTDFDSDLLDEKDLILLKAWVEELNLDSMGSDPVDVYKQCGKIKKNPYLHISAKQLQYFNRASWLSLNKKGSILLDAFYTQFFPRIKKVLATQKQSSIKDENTGDSIVGVIDMILEIDGYDKPIIFDLKTAASPYDAETLEVSDQLALYQAMKGNEYNTDQVGYVVLIKNISKDVEGYCASCAFKKDGRHKSCNNVINGSRCSGDWIEKKVPKPEVQVLIQKKTQQQVSDLLSDFSNVLHSMKSGIVYKNTQACNNWYGAKCPYFNLCHKGDPSGLKKKE